LGSPCTFRDSIFTECAFSQCDVVHESPSGHAVFANTRWYGCTQIDCTGLQGAF
jgi:hypothetical protein